jgi:hypothetical protein
MPFVPIDLSNAHKGVFIPPPKLELHPTVYTPFPNACPVTVTVRGEVAVVLHPMDPDGYASGPSIAGVYGTHCAALVDPAFGEYTPAAHCTHDEDWALEEYVPAGQSVQLVLPAALEKDPAGQGVQAEMLGAFTAAENVPAGHEAQLKQETFM